VSAHLKVFTEYFGELVMQMPIKFEVSVMQVGSSLRITVPKEVAQHLKIKKGDKLTMYSDNSHVILEKKEDP
jgi:AbrB family looped-hinge helix DNA binding protein